MLYTQARSVVHNHYIFFFLFILTYSSTEKCLPDLFYGLLTQLISVTVPLLLVLNSGTNSSTNYCGRLQKSNPPDESMEEFEDEDYEGF